MLRALNAAEIGARIRAGYKAKGLNRRRFMFRIEGHYGQIKKWEKGEAIPELDSLLRISDELGLSLDHILYGDDRPVRAPCPEFAEWLASAAPNDLTIEERVALGAHEFTPGRHPGVRYYSVALAGIRAGLSEREMHEGGAHAGDVRKSMSEM